MKIFYTALVAAVIAAGAQASLLPAEETELFAFTPVSREDATTTGECDAACEAAKDAAEEAAEAAKDAAEKAIEDAKDAAEAAK